MCLIIGFTMVILRNVIYNHNPSLSFSFILSVGVCLSLDIYFFSYSLSLPLSVSLIFGVQKDYYIRPDFAILKILLFYLREYKGIFASEKP